MRALINRISGRAGHVNQAGVLHCAAVAPINVELWANDDKLRSHNG